ncbi:MAG: hypothetical protein ABI408_13260 [Gemmatimonadaceae bacterium]
MRRLTFVLTIAAVSLSVSGCASRKPEIELTSSDFDLNPLVGEWRGTYNSAETGRSGTIAFTLRAGEAAASGDVVMLPRTDSSVASQAMIDAASIAGRQILTIHFVHKEGNNVVGTLDPYRDPECACQVSTTFQGTFRDHGTIEGTYTTVPSVPGAGVSTGRWLVTRVKRL